jgi:hypothetical protein
MVTYSHRTWNHFHYSATYNKPEYIPDIPDDFERYVFHIACFENSALFISALIEFCQEKFGEKQTMDLLEKEDSFGSTALEVALHKQNLQSAKVLFPFMNKSVPRHCLRRSRLNLAVQ